MNNVLLHPLDMSKPACIGDSDKLSSNKLSYARVIKGNDKRCLIRVVNVSAMEMSEVWLVKNNYAI